MSVLLLGGVNCPVEVKKLVGNETRNLLGLGSNTSAALGKENPNWDDDIPKLNLLPEKADKNSELLARVFTLLEDVAIVEDELARTELTTFWAWTVTEGLKAKVALVRLEVWTVLEGLKDEAVGKISLTGEEDWLTRKEEE